MLLIINVSKEAVVALDKLLKQATQPLKDRIKELENELKKSLPPEEKLKIESNIKELKRELSIKSREVQALKKMLQKYNSNIVKEAKVILEKDGIDKALAYLKSKDVQDREIHLKKQMKEFAQKYIL